LTCFRFDISPHILLLRCSLDNEKGLAMNHQAACLVINHRFSTLFIYPLHLSG